MPARLTRGRILQLLCTWRCRHTRRARLRQELAVLEDRLIRDMGSTRYDLQREARRPFWRA